MNNQITKIRIKGAGEDIVLHCEPSAAPFKGYTKEESYYYSSLFRAFRSLTDLSGNEGVSRIRSISRNIERGYYVR